MTELHQQVQRARRRILFQSFLSTSVWFLAVCLGIAAVALAVTKIRFINVDSQAWTIGWLAGSVIAALLGSAAWTWFRRSSLNEAAIEIDRRYGLKERVSSSFALSQEESETEVGKALVADAARRVKRIDVREKFGVKANRWAFLPLVTGLLAVAMVFLPDAKPLDSSKQATAKTVEVQRVKKSTTALKKKLAKKSTELEKQDLKEASKLAKKLENGIEKLAKSNSDKKKTMVEMNNLAKELQQRRKSLKGGDDLKKKLKQLKGMKIKDGPADKLAKAIQNGDFKQALDQVEQLMEKLKEGKLDPKQQEQLAKQMEQMQKKMQDMVDKQEKAKEELKEQIAKAKQQGNKAAAEKLQKKLDQMNAQNDAMQKMQKMAKQMQQGAKKMQEGDQQGAMQELAEMQADLKEMQKEMSELDALDEMMDQLAQAKDSMNCPDCDGGG